MTNPGDIVRIRSRAGGRASVYEANMWAQAFSTGLIDGNGVIQNTSPDMNVLVGGTPSKPDVIIGQNPAGYKIALDIVGQQAIQITAPATNSRIASVVAYTDDLSLQSSESNTTGSPSSCGLIVVYGTASSNPQQPSESSIRSAITSDGATGSQAVYGVLATILVASSTTAITNTLISTPRAGVGSENISSGAVTADKLAYPTLYPVLSSTGSGNSQTTTWGNTSASVTYNNPVAGNVITISVTGRGTYATANGHLSTRINVTGANTWTSQEQQCQVYTGSARMPFAITSSITLQETGNTTITLQHRGSSTAINVVDWSYLTVDVKGPVPTS